MSYAPPTISAVAAYWVAHGGLNGGIIRSIAKQVKPSYHCGKDGIDYYGRTASTDYTIRNARDQAGLTNGSAALDLSWALADKSGLRAFSNWLIAEIRAGAPDTLDIVELVWSPDGTNISGWHRWRGNDIIPNYGDDSHRWHSHIAWIRDTESHDKLAVFRRYFEGETDMVGTKPAGPFIGTAVFNGAHQLISPSNTRTRYAGGTDVLNVLAVLDIRDPAGRPLDIDGNSPPLNARDQVYLVDRPAFGVAAFALRQDVTFVPAVPPDTTPYDQADIDAAIDAAIITDRAKAHIEY